MKKIEKLQLAGGIIGTVWIVSIYHTIEKRKRDQLTSKLLAAIMQRLNPATKGLAAEKAFDVNYAQKVLDRVSGRIAVLKKSTAKRMAIQLHKGFQPWYYGGDKEEFVYGVLRNLKDKVQVSQVAKAYQDTHKVNLIEQLQDRFDAKEINKVLAIVRPLDEYRNI